MGRLCRFNSDPACQTSALTLNAVTTIRQIPDLGRATLKGSTLGMLEGRGAVRFPTSVGLR